ncbi:sulfite exporter TauE/SafE family protein [Methanobrevibacter olleyae]|uniref:Probable membrane transporter protein n=1 Tax=Methanobrevibacter olleyae TaxID=294671 RepID=A0A126QZ23_METOL|nr:sulfite exporter TauE/SafE family protein [Methanobrevibacter olleyae]AMK14919.1 TauE family transporter [Methanobrevibacter olleyae]
MFSISFFIGLVLIGIFAGFASGLLGVGGGFLMVPLQFFLFTSVGVDPSLAMMVSLGTSLAIIIPTASSGAYQHQKKNKSIVKPGIRLAIFGILGGFCGGIIANIVPSGILQIIFAGLLFIVALDMSFGYRNDGEKALIDFNILNVAIVGFLIGIISGLLGVGGGIFLIPTICILFGFSLIDAIGTSSVFIAFTAIGGLISYIYTGLGVNPIPYSVGYVSLINFVLIVMFSVPMAMVGAKLAYKMPEKRLKQIFAIVLIYMAIKMIGFDPISILLGF